MSTGKQRSLGGCLGAWAAGMAAVLASWGAQGQADVEFDEAFLRSPVDIRMFSQETLMPAGRLPATSASCDWFVTPVNCRVAEAIILPSAAVTTASLSVTPTGWPEKVVW